MNSLDELALKYGTDKSSDFHNYTDIYYRFFNDKKNDVHNVLELGVFHGNSLRMWRDFFKNAEIYGIDINASCMFEEERIKVIIGNQTDEDLLINLPDNFDIIIDDAGHHSNEQIKSFEYLFSKLKSGGMYVVEDVCCSYWSEYNIVNKLTAIEYFKKIIDQINFNGFKVDGSFRRDRNYILKNKECNEFEKYIDYIVFVNSLIFIKKI